jgi:hypothetical protein
MRDIRNSPPSWCPNAIPSDRGWRHPVTGELLVSVPGGVSASVLEKLNEITKTEETFLEDSGNAVIDESPKESETLIPNDTPETKDILEEESTPDSNTKEQTPTKTRKRRG